MLGQHGRGITRALFTAPARGLARIGVTPNMLTVAGTVATIAVAVLTLPQGRFILGPILLAAVLIGDSFDGILARLTGTSSSFGAFLDSTMDRLADGAVFGSLAVWAALHLQAGPLRTWTVAIAVTTVVLAAAVPYARARAESVGATAAVGIAERTDRLVITAVGVLAVGLGAPAWVLTAALALVAVGSLITVIQRVVTVHRQLTRPAAEARP
ncbi:phosphatidylinositol phosphate synthase [Actinomyces succiniciruminis]|uniref:Phosphatidylinositol phosphate synthase n=1 Tax=Actinomyces succiniciruminis TaxID=1522002 RepID=A0A1L7RE65_9ACTO|nr:CDP-alcohol phosphatidyltransferase family protein [Actinomyces succiniciruminis]CED92311.1 CDP-alcohol phosphatidyltransferase [Actinomyces succiniciruminis]